MSVHAFERAAPQLGRAAYVADSAQVIGAVTLGDDASIWPNTVLRGDVNTITVGARSNIQDNCVVHVTHDGPYTPGGAATVIGEDVTVGHAALIHACTIGNRCLIGMGAIVMDKAVVEDDVLVAAGSLVSPGKRLKTGWLYRGQPARPVRRLTEDERDNLAYSAHHYVTLKSRYLKA